VGGTRLSNTRFPVICIAAPFTHTLTARWQSSRSTQAASIPTSATPSDRTCLLRRKSREVKRKSQTKCSLRFRPAGGPSTRADNMWPIKIKQHSSGEDPLLRATEKESRGGRRKERYVQRIFGLIFWALLQSGCIIASSTGGVPRCGVFEQSFTHSGSYNNPYTDVTATATFTQPDGRSRSIPLFWDGGSTWKVRFSADRLGEWSWSVSSSDSGLNGAGGSFNCLPSYTHGGIVPMAGYSHHLQIKTALPIGSSETRNGRRVCG
jgi:Domain of unknown function (DUF5060)